MHLQLVVCVCVLGAVHKEGRGYVVLNTKAQALEVGITNKDFGIGAQVSLSGPLTVRPPVAGSFCDLHFHTQTPTYDEEVAHCYSRS